MALASHTPATWNDILSTTMHNYRKTLTDNVFNSRPLLNHYMSKGRVKTISGGISIVEPVMYAEGQADSYAEWDTLTVTPTPTASAAQFDWKQLYATIAISGLEEAQNNGKEMIVDLLEAKIMQAEDTLKTRLNGMLFGTYAGTTPANDFTPITKIIGNADADAVGGIVTGSGVNDWWKSQVNSTGGALTGAGLEDALRALYNATSDAGPDVVDAIFTNAYGFSLYESSLTPQVRYTDTSKANLGFQNLMFKNVPMMWDFQCSGGTEGTVSDASASFYGINSKYVGLKLHSDRNFKQSPFTDNMTGSLGAPASGAGIGSASGNTLDARVSFITTFGNHTTRNRRRLFKLLNVTAA